MMAINDGLIQNLPPIVSFHIENTEQKTAGIMAISLGIFTPLMISIFISVSRYWSQFHGYKSIDYTVDTFLCMGLIEIVLFINH
jgi:hypothetical protein